MRPTLWITSGSILFVITIISVIAFFMDYIPWKIALQGLPFIVKEFVAGWLTLIGAGPVLSLAMILYGLHFRQKRYPVF